jgi:hypothetical protein
MKKGSVAAEFSGAEVNKQNLMHHAA